MKNFSIKESILFQHDMCWQLYLYYVDNLEEEEAYWGFAPTSLLPSRSVGGKIKCLVR